MNTRLLTVIVDVGSPAVLFACNMLVVAPVPSKPAPEPGAPVGDLSGGNVQRAVLARELSSGKVRVLVAANPCFGLDFKAVADIRSQIMQTRNRGAAVLLVSEDLDEILELADRVLVISEGKIVYQTPIESADRQVIGRHMAGH